MGEKLKLEGLDLRQRTVLLEILSQCYQLVLVGCAFGIMSENFGAFFNGLQELLKDFDEELYSKAFDQGNELFMQRMKTGGH